MEKRAAKSGVVVFLLLFGYSTRRWMILVVVGKYLL